MTEILISIEKAVPCDCDVVSSCFNTREGLATVRTFAELIAFVDEHPHMIITVKGVREAKV